MSDRDDTINRPFDPADIPGFLAGADAHRMTDTGKADYIAARASESLSYGDIAYAQSQGWCSSSPDGMGPHIPDGATCAECGAELPLIERTFVFVFRVTATVPDDPEREDEAIETARQKLLENLTRWLDNGHYEVTEEVF